MYRMDVIERAADISRRFMLGEALTARQVAAEYGISRQQAHTMLDRMARVLPVRSNGGIWRVGELCQVE